MRHLLLRDVAISLIAQSHDKYTNYPPITQLFSQLLAQKNPEKIQFGERIIQKLSRKNPILEQRISNLEKEVINKLSTAFAQPIPMKKLTILTILTSLIAPPLHPKKRIFPYFILIILYIYILYNIYYLYSIYT